MAVAPSLDDSRAKNVLRQVEFYFSDSNLPRDNFLKKTVEESEDGLVSLALICTFARMRGHLGMGEMKPEEVPEETVLAVAETLRKSNYLKVSDDGKKVGRNTELSKPEEVLEQVDSRTVAASPLPYDVEIEDVESLFGQYGKVNSVRLPHTIGGKKQFCGTALIEFSEEGDARKALSGTITYAGAELEMKLKKDFDDEREKKRKEFEKKGHANKDGSDAGNDGYPKGLIVSFKLKRKRPEGSSEQNGQEVTDSMKVCKTKEVLESDGIESEGSGKTTSGNVDANEQKLVETIENERGENGDEEKADEIGVDKVESTEEDAENRVKNGNVASANDQSIITREDLKEVFQKYGTVKYIDFKMGDESGYIRFEGFDAAVKAHAAAELTESGGLVVNNHIATLELLSGDTEKQYWTLLRSNQYKGGNKGNGNGKWGKGNRGGRHFNGKRSRGDSNDGRRHNKAQKVSDEK